jgi:hypothetical protein
LTRNVAVVGGVEVKASGAAAGHKDAVNARIGNRLMTPAIRFAGENRLCRRMPGEAGTNVRAGRRFIGLCSFSKEVCRQAEHILKKKELGKNLTLEKIVWQKPVIYSKKIKKTA